METGCQNIQLCSTILKLAFPPAVIGPMFLFPLVYVSFQLSEAIVLIVLFRCYKRFARGEKGDSQLLSQSYIPLEGSRVCVCVGGLS